MNKSGVSEAEAEGTARPPRCDTCGGHHEPDSPDARVDWAGYEFTPPFRCMCCGKDICAQQFAFGRACGTCDIGACQTDNAAFRKEAVHDRPSWAGKGVFSTIVEFAAAVGAESITCAEVRECGRIKSLQSRDWPADSFFADAVIETCKRCREEKRSA